MIKGRVNHRLEPIVGIGLVGRWRFPIGVSVDTGFNGYLLLSRRHKPKILLKPFAWERCELADGRVARVKLYLGKIEFDHETRDVLVSLTRSRDSLIGASLLRDKELLVSYPRKQVVIRAPAQISPTPGDLRRRNRKRDIHRRLAQMYKGRSKPRLGAAAALVRKMRHQRRSNP